MLSGLVSHCCGEYVRLEICVRLDYKMAKNLMGLREP